MERYIGGLPFSSQIGMMIAEEPTPRFLATLQAS